MTTPPNNSYGFDSVQNAALSQLEDALAEDAQGCIGHTRKTNNKRRVWACYLRVLELKLADALTTNERTAARDAGAWLGEKEPAA